MFGQKGEARPMNLLSRGSDLLYGVVGEFRDKISIERRRERLDRGTLTFGTCRGATSVEKGKGEREQHVVPNELVIIYS